MAKAKKKKEVEVCIPHCAKCGGSNFVIIEDGGRCKSFYEWDEGKKKFVKRDEDYDGNGEIVVECEKCEKPLSQKDGEAFYQMCV